MTSTGTLLARVFTSRAQIPISGATVAITRRRPCGRHDLLATETTDQSGKSPPIRIETPPASDGQSPGGSTPFANVDLWIQAPGFEVQRVGNVPIFPGQQTVQLVELIPLPEYAVPSLQSESVQITPQNL